MPDTQSLPMFGKAGAISYSQGGLVAKQDEIVCQQPGEQAHTLEDDVE